MSETTTGPTWRCRLGWHRWAKWSAPKEGLFRRIAYGIVVEENMSALHQDRTCANCGLYDWKKTPSKMHP